jgi:hypothetical protein
MIRRLRQIVCASLFVIALYLSCMLKAEASRWPIEYSEFREICVVAEYESEDKNLLWEIRRSEIEQLLFKTFESRLKAKGISVPVEHGRQCYPGKFGETHRSQLSLQFWVIIANRPDDTDQLVIATVLHAHYFGKQTQPHEFRTSVGICGTNIDISNCIATLIVNYANTTIIDLLDRARFPISEK